MPFAHAAEELEAILGVQVSQSTVRRLTEEAGMLLCDQQQETGTWCPARRPFCQRWRCQPMERWSTSEATGGTKKSLVIGKVKPEQATTCKRDQHRRTSDHTVFSRLARRSVCRAVYGGNQSTRDRPSPGGMCCSRWGTVVARVC